LDQYFVKNSHVVCALEVDFTLKLQKYGCNPFWYFYVTLYIHFSYLSVISRAAEPEPEPEPEPGPKPEPKQVWMAGTGA